MFRRLSVCLLLLLLARSAQAEDFKPVVGSLELATGESVVFLGDSITHQCLYTQFIEDYFYTRFPQKQIRFHNAGVGGDRAADALARFDLDVAAYKPKYVVVLLGMNDGGYSEFDKVVFDRYRTGMTQLVERIKKSGATPVLMTPTMFDLRALALQDRPAAAKETYNGVLAAYGSWLRDQAQHGGHGFVDLYGPMNALTVRRRTTEPRFTMVPDAVHPDAVGQMVMAWALLRDLQCPEQVSSLHAAPRDSTWHVEATGGEISQLEMGDALKFTFLAQSLPWVVPAEALPGYELTDAGRTLSREDLRVSGLLAGNYELQIDGQIIGVYGHLELAAGIALESNAKTPQYQQALAVATLNQERNAQAMQPLRDLWRTKKTMAHELGQLAREKDKDAAKFTAAQAAYEQWITAMPAKIEELQKKLAEYDQQLYAAAQPKPHRYELKRVQ